MSLYPKVESENKATASETLLHRSLINCLEPLLKAMNWPGKRQHILEALPYMTGITNLNDFLQTMIALHYDYLNLKVDLKTINPHLTPCLFITNDDKAFVILEILNNKVRVHDGETDSEVLLDKKNLKLTGRIYIFTQPVEQKNKSEKHDSHWFTKVFLKHKNSIFYVILSFIVTSVLALGVPIFMLVTYHQIIPSGSYAMLASYLLGMLLLLAGMGLLQWLQSKLLTLVAARVASSLNNSIFERILCLAPSYTENASVAAQVARFKDFDNVYEFLSGSSFRIFFEVPFVILAIALISYLAGWIVLIPVVSMLLFIVIYSILQKTIHQNVESSAQLNNARQDYLLETVHALRTLKFYHIENTWYNRYLPLSAETTLKNYHASLLHSSLTTALDLVMSLAGYAILFFGALKVLDGQMSTAALIPTMMLAWRLLAPLKTLFGTQSRLDRFSSSVRQINSLMTIQPERDPKILVDKLPNLTGDIHFDRVTFRYPKASDFALRSISFSAKHGEVIAIGGSTGSGKSTILKLILNLYHPQTGSILMNNQDIRQFDPIQLRYSLGYTPQASNLFFGTIAQNLLIVKPTATEEELFHSCRRADLLDEIQALPDGFNTFLGDQSHIHLAQGFLQRLALARTYLKKPPIILFDEPSTTLDKKGEAALLSAIEYFRGHATIFIVTHRPSHLQLADKILLLKRGDIFMHGTPDQVLPKLPKELL